MATANVAARPHRTVSENTNTTPMVKNSIKTAPPKLVSPECEGTEPSCLDVGVSDANSTSPNFSQEVEERIRAPQRVTTRKVYDSRMKAFTKWLEHENKGTESVSIPLVAEYLLHLHKSGLRPSNTWFFLIVHSSFNK